MKRYTIYFVIFIPLSFLLQEVSYKILNQTLHIQHLFLNMKLWCVTEKLFCDLYIFIFVQPQQVSYNIFYQTSHIQHLFMKHYNKQ